VEDGKGRADCGTAMGGSRKKGGRRGTLEEDEGNPFRGRDELIVWGEDGKI